MWRTIGQSNALALFESALQTGTLSHAYLFVGLPHVGKTTLALDLAQALNCNGAKPPCGECPSCLRIIAHKHSDVITTCLNQSTVGNRSELSTHVEIGVEEIRELQRRASLPPFEGKWKVFIIDGTENLSLDAANRLLKILEEPPPNVLWLLLSSDEAKVLPTVISRCQHIELKPLSIIEVEKVLVNSHGVDTDKSKLLSRLSGGCLGWALMAATDDSHLQQRAENLSALFPLLETGWEERFNYVTQVESTRKSTESLLKLWLTWWRDLMLAKYDCIKSATNVDSILKIEEWAQILSMAEINDFIRNLQMSLDQISKNANTRLVLEVLMLDMPRKVGRGHGKIAMPLQQ